jgi:hypothetical protein
MSIAVGVTAKLSSSVRLVAIGSRSLKKPGHVPAESIKSVGVGSHWVFGLPRNKRLTKKNSFKRVKMKRKVFWCIPLLPALVGLAYSPERIPLFPS